MRAPTLSRAGRMRRPSWLVIAGVELRLLLRNRTASLSATAMPLAFCALVILTGDNASAAEAASTAGLQLTILLGCTVFMTSTTTLVARRQDLLLKRLRSSAASTSAIVVGLSAPLVGLLLLQAAAVLAGTAAGTGAAPARPDLPALAVLIGCVTCVALAFLTAAFTRTPESAQFTTLPAFIVLIGAAVWINLTPVDDVHVAQLAVPGAAVAQLTRLGWDPAAPAGTGLLESAAPAVLAAVAVATVACYVAARRFRWDRRS